MTATELILIRHGETDWNRELRFQGHVEVPLNARGFEQARRLGERMRGERVQHIVCSDLLRTRQTAEPTVQALGLPVHFDAAWREQSFGVAEGLRAEEIRQQHPEAWAALQALDADRGLPGGESTRTFHARVLAAVAELVARHAGSVVAVVTHGGVLDMVWRTVHGLSLHGPRQSEIPNTGINRVRVADASRPQALEIVGWADTGHLLL